MDVAEIRQHLPAFADGELAGDLQERVAAAVAASSALQAEVQQWRELRRAANRALTADAPPTGLRERIMAQLELLRPVRPRTIRLYQPLLAAAAAVVLAFTFFLNNTGTEAAVANPADFPNRHRICLASGDHDTLAIATLDPSTAATRLTGKYHYPVLVPDLSRAGWRVAAGRECALRCEQAGPVRMVHVFYQHTDDASRTLSVFSIERRVVMPSGCTKSKSGCGQRTYTESMVDNSGNAYAVMTWCEPRNTYAACGALPANELRGLLDQVVVAVAEGSTETLLIAAAN
jgi:anti-sigma factor RsiW